MQSTVFSLQNNILISFNMSILLIGQKSLPHPEHYCFPKNERITGQQANRIRQVRYRTQLLQQIEENKQRKLKQKQRERTFERQRQLAVLKELYKKHQNKQTQSKQWYGHKSFFDRPFHKYQYRVLQDSKLNSYNLPYLLSPYYPYYQYKPNYYESDYGRSYSRPQDRYARPNYAKPRAIKTQNSVYQPETQYLSKSEIIQNPEDRAKQLRDYENRKFKEVYEMLDKSIDAFQEISPKPITKKRSSRLKKLNEKMKNKQRINNIGEEERQLYELPYWSINKPFKQTHEEQDSQWRSWFAKEKQRGAEQNLRNQRLRIEVQDRLKGLHKRIKSKIQ